MGRRRSLVVAVGATLAAVLTAPPAHADRISDTRREAARIAERLEQLEEQASILDEDYNEAVLALRQATEEVRRAEAQVASTSAEIGAVRERVQQWAIRAYVDRSGADPMVTLLAAGVDGTAAYRQGYRDLAMGNTRDLADQLAATREDIDRARAELQRRRDRQAALSTQIEERRRKVQENIEATEALQRRVQGELARLVRAEQLRRQQEAERRAREEAARRAAARSVRRAGGTAPRVVRVPPPPSPGAAGAVEAALSMQGTPYRWASSDPAAGFDCSGLIVWAWGRAGRGGLPHSSRALFASLPRVDIEDLQPGDLVFFGRPVHHAGLYVGGGQMVHAPRRGDVVRLSSIYRRDLVGAVRP